MNSMKLTDRGRYFPFMNAEMKLKLKLKLKLHVIELDKVKELIYLLPWNKNAYVSGLELGRKIDNLSSSVINIL